MEAEAERLKAEAERVKVLVEAERNANLVEPLDRDAVRKAKAARRNISDDVHIALSNRIETDDRMEADRRAEAEQLEANRLAAEVQPTDAKRIRAELLTSRRLLANRSNKGKEKLDDDEKVQLIVEMRRVFAERFQENPKGRVMASELLEVFEKSTTLSEFNEKRFKYHSTNVFIAQWTNARCSQFQHKRCYTGVVVKTDE